MKFHIDLFRPTLGDPSKLTPFRYKYGIGDLSTPIKVELTRLPYKNGLYLGFSKVYALIKDGVPQKDYGYHPLVMSFTPASTNPDFYLTINISYRHDLMPDAAPYTVMTHLDKRTVEYDLYEGVNRKLVIRRRNDTIACVLVISTSRAGTINPPDLEEYALLEGTVTDEPIVST